MLNLSPDYSLLLISLVLNSSLVPNYGSTMGIRKSTSGNSNIIRQSHWQVLSWNHIQWTSEFNDRNWCHHWNENNLGQHLPFTASASHPLGPWWHIRRGELLQFVRFSSVGYKTCFPWFEHAQGFLKNSFDVLNCGFTFYSCYGSSTGDSIGQEKCSSLCVFHVLVLKSVWPCSCMSQVSWKTGLVGCTPNIPCKTSASLLQEPTLDHRALGTACFCVFSPVGTVTYVPQPGLDSGCYARPSTPHIEPLLKVGTPQNEFKMAQKVLWGCHCKDLARKWIPSSP